MDPTGTIVYSTVGRPFYGFDIFCRPLQVTNPENADECRLTDGVSVNYNGHFAGNDGTIVYISERTNGSPRVFIDRRGEEPQVFNFLSKSLFFDRPIVHHDRLYFISAHEPPEKPFRSWSALYSARIGGTREAVRLTPYGHVDYSPAISKSGDLIAVASYGERPWGGEFHELQTDIVVFRVSDPGRRILLCEHGGWPTWCGDSVLYFHRQAEDGWWSVFRVDLPEDFMSTGDSLAPVRITPPGLHCFTPAAMHDGKRIAVATRRKGRSYRHIEIFDVESHEFSPVTELQNPNFHHYNPFVSPESTLVGYHRFRGKKASTGDGDSTVPHLQPITSPIQSIRMLRINGFFPAFSPSGDLIAFNHSFEQASALNIVRSDGSKRWALLKNRVSFYNSWSPNEDNVIFTSIGPIFESPAATVQIARVTFNPAALSDDLDEIPVDIKILTNEGTGNNAFPACSPDGKYLVFRSGRSGHKNLYIIDSFDGELGGEIRQLTNGPWIDTMPSWSPDGKLIAFSSNRHRSEDSEVFGIYLIGADGAGLKRITVAGFDEERERLNHVCFSADGEWLLFTSNLAGVTVDPVSLPNQFQPYGDLYLARIDGSGMRRLTFNGYENGTPAWHPKLLLEASENNKGNDEDELNGQFQEPLWLICDF